MSKRFHTLEEYDGDHWKDEGVSPYSSGLWGVAQAARAALARKRRTDTPMYGNFGSLDICWCGELRDHDWPGKADGAPHPRGKR